MRFRVGLMACAIAGTVVTGAPAAAATPALAGSSGGPTSGVAVSALTPSARLPRPIVSLRLSAAAVERGSRVLAVGRVTPAIPGAKVVVVRKSGTRYIAVAAGRQDRRGAFRITFTATAVGRYLYAAVAAAVPRRKAAGISGLRALTTHTSAWLSTLPSVERDSIWTEPAKVNGVTYPYSIVAGTAGERCSRCGRIGYDLARRWRTLDVVVGLRDDAAATARGWVDVFGDGRRLARVSSSLGQPVRTRLNVTGIGRLTFVTSLLRPAGGAHLVLAGGRLTTRDNGVAPTAEALFRYLKDVPKVAGDAVNTNIEASNGTVLPVNHYMMDLDYSNTIKTNQGFWDLDLSRSFSRLRATLGLLDRSPGRASYRVEVFGDGRLLGDYTASLGTASAIDLDVSGVLRLRIQVTKVGTASSYDYISFGEAYVQP